MAQHADDSGQDRDAAARAKRAWVKPTVVEYGHLAKLTRGSSGNVNEAGFVKQPTVVMMCL
jgi:hypothetical protein